MRRLWQLFCLILLLLTASAIQAHGGGDLIAGPEPVGPYIVSVWLNPPDPRAAEPIHFTIGLASPINREPVLDAQIEVELRAVGNNSIADTAPATTDQSINKLFYETDLQVTNPNTYETIFFISGPDGDGSLMVPIEVSNPSNIDWRMLGLVGLAIIVILGWLRSRKVSSDRPD